MLWALWNQKKQIYLYTNRCSLLYLFIYLRITQRDCHNRLGFPWTVTVSTETYFLRYAFSLCKFSWYTFKGVSHTRAYKSRLVILWNNSSWHHFPAERNGKDFFVAVSHWKPKHIFFSALLTLNVWLETHLYMPATELSLPILPEPSKKNNTRFWDVKYTTAFSSWLLTFKNLPCSWVLRSAWRHLKAAGPKDCWFEYPGGKPQAWSQLFGCRS